MPFLDRECVENLLRKKSKKDSKNVRVLRLRYSNLCGSCDHVFYIIGMTWAIHVSVMSGVSLIFDVCCIDSNATCSLLRGSIDVLIRHKFCFSLLRQNLRNSSCKCCFPMINVTDCSDVNVRFIPHICA